MNWEQLDWDALDRLRGGFLSGTAANGPYWNSLSDLANYDLTYAERIGWKWDSLLNELRLRHWQPPAGGVLLDWGCGSGVAGRRALSAFGPESFSSLAVWDHSEHARAFAVTRAREVFPALEVSEFADTGQRIALLVVSHVLNELPADARTQLLALVERAEAVIWIEPGTHADSRALAALRDQLRPGHRIVAPCTHHADCPLFQAANERDWCHFFAPPPVGIQNHPGWVRFAQRVGIDLRNQAYSCLVLDRADAPQQAQLPDNAARVLGRAEVFKPYARFLACEASGLHELELPKRVAPALVKQLDKNPPIPLYALTHDGKRVITMDPLVVESTTSADEEHPCA
ncbi:MAG: small ribosomal subunit Rsm22 family protein [Rariglobus sp.]